MVLEQMAGMMEAQGQCTAEFVAFPRSVEQQSTVALLTKILAEYTKTVKLSSEDDALQEAAFTTSALVDFDDEKINMEAVGVLARRSYYMFRSIRREEITPEDLIFLTNLIEWISMHREKDISYRDTVMAFVEKTNAVQKAVDSPTNAAREIKAGNTRREGKKSHAA